MIEVLKQRLFHFVCIVALFGLVTAPANAQNGGTTCENCTASICSTQGFEITLKSFSVDQTAGTSSWVYEVCNQAGRVENCAPPKDLSHVNIDLPGFNECLTENAQVSLAQTGGNQNAVLVCAVSAKDPSCNIDNTGNGLEAKCDVADNSNLDAGECVEMTLSIAGEVPTLGAGAVNVVTKAGRDCSLDQICGPACPCELPNDGQCLTRTLGFWGTHPAITDQFNAGTVCGDSIADPVNNAIGVLCAVPGKNVKGSQSLIQLKRQLAAAKLNIAATAATVEGGNCANQLAEELTNAGCQYTTLEDIEKNLCKANQQAISGSKCIEGLNAFNRSQDPVAITPAPFDRPGPANPSICQAVKTGDAS